MRMSRVAELFQRRDPSSSKDKIEDEAADDLLKHSLKATTLKKSLQGKGGQDKTPINEILESQEQSKGHVSSEKSKAKKTANDKKANASKEVKEADIKSNKPQAKSAQDKQGDGDAPRGDMKGEILKEPKNKAMDTARLGENARNETQEQESVNSFQALDAVEEKSQKTLKPQLAQEKMSKNILAQALAGAEMTEMAEGNEEGKKEKKSKISTKKSKLVAQEELRDTKQDVKMGERLELKLNPNEDSALSLEEQEIHEEITPKMGRKKAQKNKESDSLETKSSTKEKHSSEVLSAQNAQKTQILYRSHLARESVRNFAQSLREEIINYKPPVTKLSIELNPQNLGALELTISKKGKDLHIQVISNPTAIGLFVQNQTDFKANLTQMGFENVDLSFSANDGGGAGKREFAGQNPSSQGGEEEGNKNSLEDSQMATQMNIVLPKYA